MPQIQSPLGPPAVPVTHLVHQLIRVLGIEAHFSAALHDLRVTLETPAVTEIQERKKLTEAYEATAATLRGRASRLPVGSAERSDAERRAAHYEARARVKRSGEPMPRELRTPKERLEAVALV